MNHETVVYIGERESVEKRWAHKPYVFRHGKPVAVPEDFAAHLLSTYDYLDARRASQTLEENHPDGGRLLVRRWGALGDLIMFRAAMSAFIRSTDAPYELILRTQVRFLSTFANDRLWAGVTAAGRRVATFDAVVSFDQVAEQDHRGVEAHRLDLFLRAMTKRSITVGRDDWKLPIPPTARAWVDDFLRSKGIHPDDRTERLVGVQIRGSGPMKTLPLDVVFNLIGRIREAGHQVVLIEGDPMIAQKCAFDEGTHMMVGRDVLHGIALLESVDLAITMDSGPLWMAHVAACPTLVILGPTRPAQRIAYHPLYPHSARAVCLNDLLNCPACFEKAAACRLKFDCMRKQPDWSRALDVILEAAESILRGERAPISLEQT